MYSQVQPPSRPERPSEASASHGSRSTALWIVAVALFLVASVYAVGGTRFMRQLLQVRRTATAVLQPPSDAEMQRAVQRAARDSASRAAEAEDLPKPVSLRFMATSIGTILVVVVAAFYLTGRAPRRPGSA